MILMYGIESAISALARRAASISQGVNGHAEPHRSAEGRPFPLLSVMMAERKSKIAARFDCIRRIDHRGPRPRIVPFNGHAMTTPTCRRLVAGAK